MSLNMLATPPANRAPRRIEAMRFVAAKPGASNRQVAAAIGIRDESQASRLLSRMCELGWARSDSTSSGSPNAWRLTRLGKTELQRASQQPSTGR
jgi:DNA-binding IclR family transcriptional regulator